MSKSKVQTKEVSKADEAIRNAKSINDYVHNFKIAYQSYQTVYNESLEKMVHLAKDTMLASCEVGRNIDLIKKEIKKDKTITNFEKWYRSTFSDSKFLDHSNALRHWNVFVYKDEVTSDGKNVLNCSGVIAAQEVVRQLKAEKKVGNEIDKAKKAFETAASLMFPNDKEAAKAFVNEKTKDVAEQLKAAQKAEQAEREANKAAKSEYKKALETLPIYSEAQLEGFDGMPEFIVKFDTRNLASFEAYGKLIALLKRKQTSAQLEYLASEATEAEVVTD